MADTDPSKPSTRARILAAAERLLATGRPEFSMRQLAREAGVSFATPFNQFGSKGAIMRALSTERIAVMHRRFASAAPVGEAVTRVLAAFDIATEVMLDHPAVNRAMMGFLGAPAAEDSDVLNRSHALWKAALDEGEGLADPALARSVLPYQLALAFRGVLSFWTAGEIADDELKMRARGAAAALLTGFARPEAHAMLHRLIADQPPLRTEPRTS